MPPTPSFAVKPTLVGQRVLLRPVAADDAVGLVEMLNDPEVRRLTGTRRQARPGTELERAEQWYSSRSADENRLDLAIVERHTNSYVGETVLNELDADNRSCSFRIALVGPRAFGRGYGTEATRLILSHAFGTVGMHRVALEVFAFNPRARHVYEQVGFVHEGTKRQALHWQGDWIDAHIMAVLAEDWSAHCGYPTSGK
ncbi:GNAT family N-acetyltransferase [Plantactinospora siamensis]|uniref:GNAT family N-acetyltransferase n=1 Tax=Plantactinospora siamensis TaxID=555372 RepID=A0ABV6P3V0_9ACTN